MPYSFKIFLSFFGLLFVDPSCLSGQLYFQLEKAGSLKVKKYSVGNEINFKTTKIPDEWQKGTIVEILPADGALVFDDRISYLRDFSYFRYKRPWPNGIGISLFRFGIAWMVFAGIIEGGRRLGVLDTQYEFGTDTAIIGGSSMLSGFLIKQLWSEAIIKINERNRVRIIDLRF